MELTSNVGVVIHTAVMTLFSAATLTFLHLSNLRGRLASMIGIQSDQDKPHDQVLVEVVPAVSHELKLGRVLSTLLRYPFRGRPRHDVNSVHDRDSL